MKKFTVLIALLLAAVLVAGCSSSSSKAPAGAETASQQSTETEFPQELVGLWKPIDEKNNGYNIFSSVPIKSFLLKYLGFTYDGHVYGTMLYDRNTVYSPTETAIISGNEIIIPALQAYHEGMKITYKLEDAQESRSGGATEATNELFAANGSDLLTLHLTGTVETSPTQSEDIDYTIILEKIYFGHEKEDTVYAELIGEWSDNYGNSWVFKKNALSSDLKNNTLKFSCTAHDGKTYSGSSVYYSWIVDSGEETLSIHADKDFDINSAVIKQLDQNSLHLVQQDGTDLILTRIS